jgi:hypothetical protein
MHPAQVIVELGVHIKGNASIGTERRTGWKRRGHGERNLRGPVEAIALKHEAHPLGDIQSERTFQPFGRAMCPELNDSVIPYE